MICRRSWIEFRQFRVALGDLEAILVRAWVPGPTQSHPRLHKDRLKIAQEHPQLFEIAPGLLTDPAKKGSIFLLPFFYETNALETDPRSLPDRPTVPCFERERGFLRIGGWESTRLGPPRAPLGSPSTPLGQ